MLNIYNKVKSNVTYVIIHELTKDDSKLDFISSLKNLKINHIVEVNSLDCYHRTRQLNEMLNIVKTPVVVNYDIDVILPVDSYIESQNLIVNGNSDFVYPYGDGKYQREISLEFNRNEFNLNFNIESINNNLLKELTSKYGHCVFANTKKYRKCGGENENFIGYGPEDQERENRFITLKYNVSRVDNLVYHFEHSRTPFSNGDNKYYDPNHKLCDKLLAMDYKTMLDYYDNVEYRQKYNKFN
jgi:predicted glycosyltransferase involved in capsule biosynthesis